MIELLKDPSRVLKLINACQREPMPRYIELLKDPSRVLKHEVDKQGAGFTPIELLKDPSRVLKRKLNRTVNRLE